MNKICFFIGVFITLLLAGCSSNPISHVRVATFNIRYDNPGDSLNSWKYRKEKVCEFIREKHPDVLGMQEVLNHQLKDLLSAGKKRCGTRGWKDSGGICSCILSKR